MIIQSVQGTPGRADIRISAHNIATESARLKPNIQYSSRKRPLLRSSITFKRASSRDILELFRFIGWVLVLAQGLEEGFQVELERFEAERNMPYITCIERGGIEKGIQQGIQQGETQLLKRLLTRAGRLLEAHKSG